MDSTYWHLKTPQFHWLRFLFLLFNVESYMYFTRHVQFVKFLIISAFSLLQRTCNIYYITCTCTALTCTMYAQVVLVIRRGSNFMLYGIFVHVIWSYCLTFIHVHIPTTPTHCNYIIYGWHWLSDCVRQALFTVKYLIIIIIHMKCILNIV